MKLTNLKDKNQFKFFMTIKKSDLRQELKQKKQQISKAAHHELSQMIVKQIETLSIFKNTQHIGIYYPIYQEVDVLALIKHLEKKFYLPRINSQNMLEFHRCKHLNHLIPNPWGIPEPSPNNPVCIPELLIIPMLGFDLSGNRLGYGKGYYDQYLQNKQKTFCLGVAFDFQEIHRIPDERHDIKMDLIVTESRLIKVGI